jgi:hypothetical protein
MADRTVEDRLREEYFSLLPEMRRVAEYLEVMIRHQLLSISDRLERFERIVVKGRVKECESAVGSLLRRQEGEVFDPDRIDSYTLTSLKDLAGVRVLAFPRNRLGEIDAEVRKAFPRWTADPVSGPGGEALKYSGYCPASKTMCGEYQIVPLLTGLFWEIEHSAIYKPVPRLKNIVESPDMQASTAAVLEALNALEAEFERLVRRPN